MKLIDEKKINKYIMAAILFVSFGYANYLPTRGILAYLSYTTPSMAQTTLLFNDVVAILLGGIVPLLVYEVITAFAARFVGRRTGGAADAMKYALRFFYIGANLVIGSVKFVYFAVPYLSVFGNILIDFIVTTCFFVWFLFYSAKHYVKNTYWGAMLLSVGGTYLIVEAVIAVIALITGLAA
ncbi:MAG: hypothetical protein K2M95_05625 [Clostridiales bacterium]|nr:hypothetical protein [Clostridiales bacterium]